MAEMIKAGPGGYSEVSGAAGTPHSGGLDMPAPQAAAPFTPPDTSDMGYGAHAGGAAGPKGTGGGGLAGLISTAGKLIELLPEAAA